MKNKLIKLEGNRHMYKALLLIMVCSTSWSLYASKIEINPEYEYSVNGYSKVQGVFGTHCNGWQRDLAKKEIRALNLNSARGPIWIWSKYDKKQKNYLLATPGAARHYNIKPGNYYKTYDAAIKAWKNWADNVNIKSDLGPAMDKFIQGASNDMAYQIKLNAEYGIMDNISIFMGQYHIDGRVEYNMKKMKDYFDEYVAGLQKNSFGTRIKYLEWYNEPSYSDFVDMYANTKDAVNAYIRIFNTMYDVIEKKHPDVKMVGNCVSSGIYYTWSGWGNWVVPFLEKAKYIGIYDYHNYGYGALTSLNRMRMLQAKAEALRGKRPRGMITECNYELMNPSKKAEKFRFIWNAEDILTMAGNPDKFAMRCIHMLSSYPGAKSGKSSIIWVNKDRTKFRLNDLYWSYWVLADARGKLVKYISDDPDSTVFASSPKKNELVLCVLNPTGFTKETDIFSGLPENVSLKNVKVRYAYYAGGELVHEEKVFSKKTDFKLKLKPYSLMSIEWDTAGENHICIKKLREQEFYARNTAQTIKQGDKITITVPELPASNDVTYLCMGVSSDDLLGARGISFTFNNHKHEVLWEDTRKQVQETIINNWLIKIPIPRSFISKRNNIVFTKLDTSYKLMYASIVYKGTKSPFFASKLEKELLSKEKRRIAASVQVSSSYVSGELGKIDVMMLNNSETSKKCSVKIKLPSLLVLQNENVSSSFELQAGQRKNLRYIVKPVDLITQQSCELQIDIDAGDAHRTIVKQIGVFPKRAAFLFSTPPCIDANPDEWKNIPPVIYKRNGITAETKLGWDKKNFYSLIKIAGRKPEGVYKVSQFWHKDSIEYFFDMGNEKKYIYDGNDQHLFAAPFLTTDKKPYAGWVKMEKIGDYWEEVGIERVNQYKIQSKILKDGYIIECAMPWKQFGKGFVAMEGAKIGFDIAITPQQTSIFGLDAKYYRNPDKWGVLMLKGKVNASDKAVLIDKNDVTRKKHLFDFNSATTFDKKNLFFRGGKIKQKRSCLEMNAPSGKYRGSCVKVIQPVTNSLNKSGITTKIVFDGFEKGDAGKGKLPWSQLFRAGWVENVPEGYAFADPYTMPGPLFMLLLEYPGKGKTLSVSLYKKFVTNGTKGGYGDLLWKGTVKKTFPLKISIWLSNEAYTINAGKDALTDRGSKSGLHGLKKYLTGRPLMFLMRNINGSDWKGKVKIRSLGFLEGKYFDKNQQ